MARKVQRYQSLRRLRVVLCARLCTYPGKGGAATGTPRRNGSDDAEAILRTQLDFAQAMVGNIAKSTEAYQLMWGRLVARRSGHADGAPSTTAVP